MILKPGMTRWLSLYHCIDRIINQYNPLLLYLTNLVAERLGVDDDSGATFSKILSLLKDPFTLPYLGFLKYALNIFNKFNATFQSETPLLQDLKQYVSNLLLDFGRGYLKNSYIESLESRLKINPTPTQTRKNAQPSSIEDDPLISLEDVYVGKYMLCLDFISQVIDF